MRTKIKPQRLRLTAGAENIAVIAWPWWKHEKESAVAPGFDEWRRYSYMLHGAAFTQRGDSRVFLQWMSDAALECARVAGRAQA